MSDHFFKSLKIENFRGIPSLEIEDLARINLFVGKNNTGKTTVLESIFLLTGISNPSLIIAIDNFRGLTIKDGSTLRDYYYGRDHMANLCLSGNSSTQKRKLVITPLYTEQLQFIPAFEDPKEDNAQYTSLMRSASSDKIAELTGLKYGIDISMESGSPISCEEKIQLKKEGDAPTFEWKPALQGYDETLVARFDTPKMGYDPKLINQMIKKKQKDLILDAIKAIESKVVDVMEDDGIVLVDIGYDNFMPINLLGDGMIRILKLISAIVPTAKGIFIVDEIGNGLHVSAIKDMWRMILDQSKKLNTQIFATTHSKDVVEVLQEMMAKKEIKEGEVATYFLDKTPKAGVKAYKQSTKQMVRAWETGSDIRI